MLEWLKGILGDAYTEEIDKAVAAEIGKAFVAKADFDAKNTELKAAKAQLADAGATIEGLRAEGKDLETLRRESEEYKARAAKAEQDAAAQLEDYKFSTWFDGLVAKHKGRDAAVIRALAGEEKLAALRESEFQSTLPAGGATVDAAFSAAASRFQSTFPARGATGPQGDLRVNAHISIHAPREGSDSKSRQNTVGFCEHSCAKTQFNPPLHSIQPAFSAQNRLPITAQPVNHLLRPVRTHRAFSVCLPFAHAAAVPFTPGLAVCSGFPRPLLTAPGRAGRPRLRWPLLTAPRPAPLF